ncbi:Metacaspase-1, partial [Durusdinium trenchii]
RIRERLEEEDFDQVPQLATSLLIELNQPFSLTTISLPAKPGTQAARGFDSGGASGPGTGGANVGGNAAMLVGSSALLAGFMASMATAPSGQQMLANARSSDGCTPYANIMGGGGFGADQIFNALQAGGGSQDSGHWWDAATSHVKRMSSSTINEQHLEIKNETNVEIEQEQNLVQQTFIEQNIILAGSELDNTKVDSIQPKDLQNAKGPSTGDEEEE